MAEFKQEPGLLNLTATHRDDFYYFLHFNIDLTGYKFLSLIKTPNGEVPLTVIEIDLALGDLELWLPKNDLLAIKEGLHTWGLVLDSGTRDRLMLAGSFKVNKYI